MRAQFEGFTITMTEEQAKRASHPGDCSTEVAELAENHWMARQLDAIGPDAIRQELKECGGWIESELQDDAVNRHRIVWIAAGNIREGLN